MERVRQCATAPARSHTRCRGLQSSRSFSSPHSPWWGTFPRYDPCLCFDSGQGKDQDPSSCDGVDNCTSLDNSDTELFWTFSQTFKMCKTRCSRNVQFCNGFTDENREVLSGETLFHWIGPFREPNARILTKHPVQVDAVYLIFFDIYLGVFFWAHEITSRNYF